MRPARGGVQLLLCGALLLAAAARGGAGAALGEVFKYGDDPEGGGPAVGGTHWTYDQAGADWEGRDAAGAPWVCLTGTQQSPVNLAPAAAAPLAHAARFSLGALPSNGSNVAVANTGHSVQVFWDDDAFAPRLTVPIAEGQPLTSHVELRDGSRVAAATAMPLQAHFHTQSEHLVDGRLFPLEAHLVSRAKLPACPPGGCLVITAVLFELDPDMDADNAWLAPLFEAMPMHEGEVAHLPAGTRFDLQALLPAGDDVPSYLAYSGSLTTPPCSEGVLWLVMLTPQRLSLRQWRAFGRAVGDYNCTLAPEPAPGVGGAGPGASAAGAATRRALLQSGGRPSPAALARARRRRLQAPAAAAAPRERFACDKLGAGANFRLPQPLQGRAVRAWLPPAAAGAGKKGGLLPGDAATAASAGAVAGIVLGVTLGAGLTALAGYVGWRTWSRRRVAKMHRLGAGLASDMAAVTQEVEAQWLVGGAGAGGGSAPVARLSRGGGALSDARPAQTQHQRGQQRELQAPAMKLALLLLCALVSAVAQTDPFLGKPCYFAVKASGVCRSTTSGLMTCASLSTTNGGRGSTYASWDTCCAAEFGSDAIATGRCRNGDAAPGAAATGAAPAATAGMAPTATPAALTATPAATTTAMTATLAAGGAAAAAAPCFYAVRSGLAMGACRSTTAGAAQCASLSVSGGGRGATHASWADCCRMEFGPNSAATGRCTGGAAAGGAAPGVAMGAMTTTTTAGLGGAVPVGMPAGMATTTTTLTAPALAAPAAAATTPAAGAAAYPAAVTAPAATTAAAAGGAAAAAAAAPCFYAVRSGLAMGACLSTTAGAAQCASLSASGGGRGATFTSWAACCSAEFGPNSAATGRCAGAGAAPGGAVPGLATTTTTTTTGALPGVGMPGMAGAGLAPGLAGLRGRLGLRL
ncbi:CAH2 [Scenedesmus sp. PABB004]|nr:CAH2 [Scenedesmus sp. PABB004]